MGQAGRLPDAARRRLRGLLADAVDPCPTQLEALRPCLEAFVPVVQQAAVDYITDPDRANAIIVDAVEQFDTFWIYDEGLAEFSVKTQRELGLVGNGPDDTLGNMDEARVQRRARPDPRRRPRRARPTSPSADLFTNEFIDPASGCRHDRRIGGRTMTTPTKQLHLTMTAAIHARFAHRVDGLVHSHPWSIEATVEGPADAAKVMPADDLEALLHQLVEPWRGRYLTDADVGRVEGLPAARVGRRADGRGDRPAAVGPVGRRRARAGVARRGRVDRVRPLPHRAPDRRALALTHPSVCC